MFAGATTVNIRRIGGGPTTSVASGSSPAWSPTGREIAFVRDARLLAIDLGTRAERTIVDPSGSCPEDSDRSIEGPDWSPDGSRLVFALVCDDGRFASTSALVVRADGTGLRGLSLGDLYPTRLAWSPDGDRVAFVTEDVRRRLRTARLDAARRTTVVRDATGAAYLDLDW